MRAFARLLDCLVYTQSRNRKVALLGRYFRTTPDPDRGWALAALTDGVPLRLPLRRMLMDLVSRFIDPVLYRLSRDYVGDTAETVSLLWPDDSSVSSLVSITSDEDVGDKGSETLMLRTLQPLPLSAIAEDAMGRRCRAAVLTARRRRSARCRTAPPLSERNAWAGFSISSMPRAAGRF